MQIFMEKVRWWCQGFKKIYLVEEYVEVKGQLDATNWFLLQNLLFAQHDSGNIMPIIRSSRFTQMAVGCGTWPSTTGSSHLYNSRTPDDGHNGARNMLSK